MSETFPVTVTGLPESIVSYWFIREGEMLTPGPLVALHTRTRAYMLVIPTKATLLQGMHLQQILANEGDRVTADIPLALLQPDSSPAPSWQVEPENDLYRVDGQPSIMSPVLELPVHSFSPIHAALARRWARYRHLFRHYYPLLALDRHALALCLTLGTWGLTRGMILSTSALLGENLAAQPPFFFLSTAATWTLLASCCWFLLLLILRSIQVLRIRKHRLLWQQSASRFNRRDGYDPLPFP